MEYYIPYGWHTGAQIRREGETKQAKLTAKKDFSEVPKFLEFQVYLVSHWSNLPHFRKIKLLDNNFHILGEEKEVLCFKQYQHRRRKMPRKSTKKQTEVRVQPTGKKIKRIGQSHRASLRLLCKHK